MSFHTKKLSWIASLVIPSFSFSLPANPIFWILKLLYKFSSFLKNFLPLPSYFVRLCIFVLLPGQFPYLPTQILSKFSFCHIFALFFISSVTIHVCKASCFWFIESSVIFKIKVNFCFGFVFFCYWHFLFLLNFVSMLFCSPSLA